MENFARITPFSIMNGSMAQTSDEEDSGILFVYFFPHRELI